MSLTVYHYPNCSTCKKALAWLRDRGIAFEAIDIVQKPPKAAVIARAQKLGAIPTNKLFNVAGESYRAGDFKSKLPGMSDGDAHRALAADGKLIKRPLAVDEERGVALVGFSEAAWAAALG